MIYTLLSQRRMPVLTMFHYLYGKLTEEMSNQGFKVVLSGYGADEVLMILRSLQLFFKYLKLKRLKKFELEVKEWKNQFNLGLEIHF